jgi:hypothetical protein
MCVCLCLQMSDEERDIQLTQCGLCNRRLRRDVNQINLCAVCDARLSSSGDDYEPMSNLQNYEHINFLAHEDKCRVALFKLQTIRLKTLRSHTKRKNRT